MRGHPTANLHLQHRHAALGRPADALFEQVDLKWDFDLVRVLQLPTNQCHALLSRLEGVSCTSTGTQTTAEQLLQKVWRQDVHAQTALRERAAPCL